MLVSPQTIEIHFKEIMNLSVQLQELSRTIDTVAQNEFIHMIHDIKADWNSECADIISGKEVEIAADLAQESNILKSIATEMECQAKKMYQTEMFNTQLALTRIYE